MTWLDQILAVPTIGFRFEPYIHSEHEIISSLRPLFERWHKLDFEISLETGATSTIKRSDGFTYKITGDTLVVQFLYPYQLKEIPGKLPSLNLPFESQQYGALLKKMVTEVCEFNDYIVGKRSTMINRIGIVANCRIDAESLPPGLAEFMNHLKSPWKNTLVKCVVDVTPILSNTDEFRDQCHHRINASEDLGNNLRFSLDWQRVWAKDRGVQAKSISKSLGICVTAALDYFELFARGELNYAGTD